MNSHRGTEITENPRAEALGYDLPPLQAESFRRATVSRLLKRAMQGLKVPETTALGLAQPHACALKGHENPHVCLTILPPLQGDLC